MAKQPRLVINVFVFIFVFERSLSLSTSRETGCGKTTKAGCQFFVFVFVFVIVFVWAWQNNAGRAHNSSPAETQLVYEMLQVPQYILDEAVRSGCGSKVRNNFCLIIQLDTAILPTF